MLIICAGPDSFRARLKYRDLVDAYKKKYDEKGATIEHLASDNLYETLLSKLSNQSLFASKKLLVCEGLFQKLTAKQASNLRDAIYRDADISVVIDYEEKAPKATAIKSFEEKELFVYAHELAKGAELNKIVKDLCKRYGVTETRVPSLIQRYQSDLWAIYTALQVICVAEDGDEDDFGSATQADNMFALVDMLLKNQKSWMGQYDAFDINGILNSSVSQMRTWHMVQEGVAKGAHPFVQKKLSGMRIKESDKRFQQFLKTFFASRQSLATGDEIVQLLV
jgi:DNA polymerase III delta subunit